MIGPIVLCSARNLSALAESVLPPICVGHGKRVGAVAEANGATSHHQLLE